MVVIAWTLVVIAQAAQGLVGSTFMVPDSWSDSMSLKALSGEGAHSWSDSTSLKALSGGEDSAGLLW